MTAILLAAAFLRGEAIASRTINGPPLRFAPLRQPRRIFPRRLRLSRARLLTCLH